MEEEIDGLIREQDESNGGIDHGEAIARLEASQAELRTADFERDEAEYNRIAAALGKLSDAYAVRREAEENARREQELAEE